jgi:DNA-binding beta-propeller fold protein YncE
MRSPLAALAAFAAILIAAPPFAPAHATQGIEIRPEALTPTGKIDDSTWLMPTGRLVTPVGDLLTVDHLPHAVCISPDGEHAVVSCSGSGQRSLTVIDLGTRQVVQVLPQPSVFLGLRFADDGNTLYASGGGQGKILVLDFAGGELTPRATWDVLGHVNGLDLGPGEKILYATTMSPAALVAKDVESGELLDRAVCGGDPFAVVVNPRFKQVYVSAERDNRIDVYNVELVRHIRWAGAIKTPDHPEAMIVSDDGKWLYVVNADDDSFSIVDLIAKRVHATFDLRPFGGFEEYGSSPDALTISPDRTRLYIAQAADNAVAVVGLPHGELIGRIPTAGYPLSVAVTPDGETLIVGCGKGTGTIPDGALRNQSVVQVVAVPGQQELAEMSQRVTQNLRSPGQLFVVDEEHFSGPVPLHRGDPSPIEHVMLVVRENKTYDALLGDWSGARGDPSNCVFCGDVTPNLHALVEEFGSGDNYYSNAEVSLQGHELTTASIVNAYTERQHQLVNRGRPMELDVMFNPTTFPTRDFVFQNCIRSDIRFRDYGESIGLAEDLLLFDPRYVHWGLYDPPVFWLQSRDVDKMAERIEEWESGIFPPFIYMSLPNDHNQGCQWPYPSPESMVADNDEATGRLIDWLSHSEYWENTVVFVIEDDPQQGRDHVDPHRSILLLAGGWVRRGYVSPVHFSEPNIHATIEHILGLPPMTVFDEIAQPMWDLFADEPDPTPYDYIPRIIPPGPCEMGTEFARRSEGLEWTVPDQAEGLDQLSLDYSHAYGRGGDGPPELSPSEAQWAQVWRSIGEVLREVGPDDPGALEPSEGEATE